MFWKFHLDSGGIDSLLEKDDVTLKEVLDKEEILQECKAQNSKLIDLDVYLKLCCNQGHLSFADDNILKELLHHVIDDPDESLEESVKYKYKNLACEVLTSDLEPVLEKVATNEEYLDILWSYVETSPPLNPLIASFFSKVLSHLVWRKSEETLNYLKSHDAVNKLIVHIDTSAIIEIFLNFLKFNTMEDSQVRLEISRWYNENELIEKAIDKLHPSHSEESHYNVSQLITELVRMGRDTISQEVGTEEDPLLLTCEKYETIEKMLAVMLDNIEHSNSDSSMINGISIITSFLEVKRPVIEGMEELITQKDIDRIAQGVYTTLDVLAHRLKDFHKLLEKPPRSISPMETTFGLLDPPLGKVRLNIAALVSKAVATNTNEINNELAKTDILKTLLELFSTYEWNNFLHTHVQELIQAILYSENLPPACLHDKPAQNNSSNDDEHSSCAEENETQVKENVSTDSDRKEEDKENLNEENDDQYALLKQLFKSCDIVQRCLELWEKNSIGEKSEKPRKGYMGHLTRIINDIVRAKEEGPNHETIRSLFDELNEETQNEWQQLVENDLEEVNKKNICVPMNAFDSDDESVDKPSLIAFEGTLQQAFENYQVQHMTNEFIETFGYDENLDEPGNLKNPFVDVGKIDLSINANTISSNEELFNSVCSQKIKAFEDDDDEEDDSDEDDVWEEKQLTFTSPPEPREAKTIIESDSDSSGDDDVSNSSKEKTSSKDSTEEKMDVDIEWTANFDSFGMDVQNEDSSNWAAAQPATNSSHVFKTNNEENFADFTDISKFDLSPEAVASPVAMETDLTKTVGASTAYEVTTMDTSEDNRNANTVDTIELTVITSSVCASTDFVVIDTQVTSGVTPSHQKNKPIDVVSPTSSSIIVNSSVVSPSDQNSSAINTSNKRSPYQVRSPESPDLPMASSDTNDAPKETLFVNDKTLTNTEDVKSDQSNNEIKKTTLESQQNGPTILLESEKTSQVKT